jgi:hypothetical protein
MHEMSMDFTVIQAVRQRFGDNKRDGGGGDYAEYQEIIVGLGAPFVGTSKDF